MATSMDKEVISSLVAANMLVGSRDDQFNGQGVYTWSNGDKYVGEFKNDQFNGQGTYTLPMEE